MDNKPHPRPLFEVSLEIAADLERASNGKMCAACGKPFNAARKSRGAICAQYSAPSGEYISWSWLLCRKCAHDVKRNGNTVPAHLRREAEREAALLMATPGGTA